MTDPWPEVYKRTIDDLRHDGQSWTGRDRLDAFYKRLGRLTTEAAAQALTMSGVRRIAKTWRSNLGWRLYGALGLRR